MSLLEAAKAVIENWEHGDLAAAVRQLDEEMQLEQKPQIYVFLTSGGLLDWEVTRGEVEVIHADWDENAERTVEDWKEMRERLSELVDVKLRDTELAAIDEEIDRLKGDAEADAILEAQARQARIQRARQLLQEEGELPRP